MGWCAISPTLPIWVAKWTMSMPIIPTNPMGKEPSCVTCLDVEAMVITCFMLVLFPCIGFWYTPKSLLGWAWGALVDTCPSSINI